MTKISIGVVVAVAGWIFLLAFAGVDAGRGRAVINLHSVTIANNAILLGYALVLWGVIEDGINKIVGNKTEKTAALETSQAASQAEPVVDVDSNEPEQMSETELAARKKSLETALAKMKK